MEYTQNYHLPQWVETDRILMDDFNEAYSAIDAALDGLREDVDANESAIAASDAAHASFGNCKFYTGSYVGAGSSQPISHTFPAKPALVAVLEASSGYGFLSFYGMPTPMAGNDSLDMTWSGNTVTWFNGGSAAGGMDYPGSTYNVLAILELEA